MSEVSDLIQRLVAAARPLAELNGYPFTQRADRWVQRLQVNMPELQTLDQLSRHAGPAPHYRFPPPPVSMPSPAAAASPQETAAPAGDLAAAAFDAAARARAATHLNAFVSIASDDDIREQANAVAQAAGPLPLAGVPVAVKDLIAVKGFRLTCGSHQSMAQACTTDAAAVARLRDAGALIIGMANLHELAYGITSANPHYGTVANPRAPGRTAGGSSGGSAAAVAAGIVPASVGTDTAGSIRIPAACCGVVGFKPTYDVIPRDGALDLGPSLDHIGPIARSVADAASLFAVMAGVPAQALGGRPDLHGLRVGIPQQYFFEPLSAGVRQQIDQGLQHLRQGGAQLVPVSLEGLQDAPAVQFATLCSEATVVHWRRLLEHPDTLGEDVRVRLEIGQLLPALWYTRVQGVRQRFLDAMLSVFGQVDVIATPTLRTTPPRTGQATVELDGRQVPLHTAMTSLTLPFNLTGLPAITLPCGSVDGAPVGLQLVAAPYRDWSLLEIAAQVEAALSGINRSTPSG